MILRDDFLSRRRQLMRIAGPGAIILIRAASTQFRSADVDYPFRQNSDFQYLTGFPEPEALLALIPGREQGEHILFCQQKTAQNELLHGQLVGLDNACDQFAMDDAFPIEDIDDILPGLIEGCERVFYSLGKDREFDQSLVDWLRHLRQQTERHGGQIPEEFISLDHILHEMRLIKTRSEVRNIRKAAKLSNLAHKELMAATRPGVTEYYLRARFMQVLLENNVEPAYQPIVASGHNTCTLHYVRCTETVKDNDLILVDAGAEFDCYASDITRTFPANGQFSAAQKDLYQVVLAAHNSAIEHVKQDASWDEPHQAAVAVICDGLHQLGIVKETPEDCHQKEAYKAFFMHRVGHWLGMDVHDVGDYRIENQWRILEPGMVMTIEPGLYIPNGSDVPTVFQGMGIRVEDDIALRKQGIEILSNDLPRDVEGLQDLIGTDYA
ncbi:MAG: aminopeptidase P N-terminal domain-containing protein [bacterium]